MRQRVTISHCLGSLMPLAMLSLSTCTESSQTVSKQNAPATVTVSNPYFVSAYYYKNKPDMDGIQIRAFVREKTTNAHYFITDPNEGWVQTKSAYRITEIKWSSVPPGKLLNFEVGWEFFIPTNVKDAEIWCNVAIGTDPLVSHPDQTAAFAWGGANGTSQPSGSICCNFQSQDGQAPKVPADSPKTFAFPSAPGKVSMRIEYSAESNNTEFEIYRVSMTDPDIASLGYREPMWRGHLPTDDTKDFRFTSGTHYVAWTKWLQAQQSGKFSAIITLTPDPASGLSAITWTVDNQHLDSHYLAEVKVP